MQQSSILKSLQKAILVDSIRPKSNGTLAKSFSRSNKFEVVDGRLCRKGEVSTWVNRPKIKPPPIIISSVVSPRLPRSALPRPIPGFTLKPISNSPSKTPAQRLGLQSRIPRRVGAPTQRIRAPLSQTPLETRVEEQTEDVIEDVNAEACATSVHETSDQRFERAWDLLLETMNNPARRGWRKDEDLSFGVGEGLSVLKRQQIFRYLREVEFGEPPSSAWINPRMLLRGCDILPIGATCGRWRKIKARDMRSFDNWQINDESLLSEIQLVARRAMSWDKFGPVAIRKYFTPYREVGPVKRIGEIGTGAPVVRRKKAKKSKKSKKKREKARKARREKKSKVNWTILSTAFL